VVDALRGSVEDVAAERDCNKGEGFSEAGVAFREDIGNDLMPEEIGLCAVGESSAVCCLMREGRGECMGVSMDFGGDFGDCTSTLGGDLVFERGGEKAIRDVGRGLERLAGVSNALPRGVAGPFAVESDK
jgi:hypothetical protein